ncbi:hypothetical protein MKX03_030556, partial [Papaver bracteatum]
ELKKVMWCRGRLLQKSGGRVDPLHSSLPDIGPIAKQKTGHQQSTCSSRNGFLLKHVY